jgi:hypothetical protein
MSKAFQKKSPSGLSQQLQAVFSFRANGQNPRIAMGAENSASPLPGHQSV